MHYWEMALVGDVTSIFTHSVINVCLLRVGSVVSTVGLGCFHITPGPVGHVALFVFVRLAGINGRVA